MLETAGFEVTLLETGPFREEPRPELGWVTHLLERYLLDTDLRGDGIYAVGRKTGPVRERYPAWLYSGGEHERPILDGKVALGAPDGACAHRFESAQRLRRAVAARRRASPSGIRFSTPIPARCLSRKAPGEPLDADVAPGESAATELSIRLPPETGRYHVFVSPGRGIARLVLRVAARRSC